MKPLKGDQQLRSVSLSYSVAAPGVRTKSLSTKRRGLDASTDRGLTERSGEVFLLDILSHRMSVMAIFASSCMVFEFRTMLTGPSSSQPVERSFWSASGNTKGV